MYGDTGRRDKDSSRTDRRQIHLGMVTLEGELHIPEGATGVALFAHGSGSSRHSPRNQFVARVIREARVGTLKTEGSRCRANDRCSQEPK